MKFKVDENACIGCGACEAICDEVFEISDDGFAITKDEKITNEETKEKAISAMESCPTNAISKTDEKEA